VTISVRNPSHEFLTPVFQIIEPSPCIKIRMA
jgi:hypothetical protein